jgi:hypothetical protein
LNEVFSIFFGISRGLCEQNGTVFWGHLKFIEEAVVPHLLHVLHVDDDAVDDWPGEVENPLFGCDFVPDVYIFLVHPDHLAWLLRFAYNGRKVAFRRVVSGEAHFYKS